MTTPTRKTCYIETFGCQMNVLDSELVAGRLVEAGYRLTDDPRQADTVLVNTCSVRAHAEDKVYSLLGKLRQRKAHCPELVIGVIGCMAQKDQRAIFQRAPHVDVVCGPGRLGRLAELVDAAHADAQARGRLAVSRSRRDGSAADVRDSFEAFEADRLPGLRPRPFQAYVRAMSGCNRLCSYCVVPGVRGPERSRSPEAIVAEVRRLADQGVREVTLLGQTVNNYRYRTGDGRQWRLSDLLAEASRAGGVRRLKFITNFPRYMTRDLIQAVADLPKVCPHLHVPAQSGSDEVLARMKRQYTADQYRNMAARVRELAPAAALSTDFIVGFPGETDADFHKTVDLVAELRFKQIFVFKYSPRPGTAAAALRDDVSPDEKKRRNALLLGLQDRIGLEERRRLIGRSVEVLVEGPSRMSHRDRPNGGVQLVGRTDTDHIVVFDGAASLAGRFVPVLVTDATPLALVGRATPS